MNGPRIWVFLGLLAFVKSQDSENSNKTPEEHIVDLGKEGINKLNEIFHGPEKGIMNQDNGSDGEMKGDIKEGGFPGANFLFGVPAESIPPELKNVLSKGMVQNKSPMPQQEKKEPEPTRDVGFRQSPEIIETPQRRQGGISFGDSAQDVLTHNCTVIEAKRSADISVPQLEQRFQTVHLKVKKIVQKDYCYQSVSTICKETQKHIENRICKYSYKTEQKDSVINSVKVHYKKKADTKWVTVCKHTFNEKLGYGNGYGQPDCKEVSQRIAFNSPILEPDRIPVTVSYPVPVKDCVSKPIILPSIKCETKTEERCVKVPDIEEEVREIQISHYALGKPQLRPVILSLPQQVCAEIVKAF